MTLKIFIKKTILFFSFLLSIVIAAFILLNLYHELFLNEVRLNSNINTVFIGDSHIQTAIDDRLIENSINISSTAESYYYSYYKLRRYLSSNPQIKRIYLGFSYHNFSNYYDDYINGKHSVNVTSGFFFVLPIAERIKCLTWNAHQPIIYLKKIFTSDISKLLKIEHEGYINNFKNVSASEEEMNKKLADQYYSNGKVNGYSNINLDYLDRIIALCKENKIELIFLSTPLHPYYRERIPDVFRKKYNELKESKKIKLVDLSTFSLPIDCYIPDGVHVSQRGSVIISELLQEYQSLNDIDKQ
ncbi:MAG: hypothetical protein IPM14_14920 [bacterium]|nr:hypothetical protein [bacterium]